MDAPNKIEAETRHHGSADYALRTAQQNMMHLSAMADQKASVVLASSFVMATIVFGDVDDGLDAVRVLLLITAVASAILAALALAPKLGFSKPDRVQPLFFGSIAATDRDEYQELMHDILDDREEIYRTIIDDLHTTSGILMTSKYRPLQASYAVLVGGMVLTLVVALAA